MWPYKLLFCNKVKVELYEYFTLETKKRVTKNYKSLKQIIFDNVNNIIYDLRLQLAYT